jgi:lipopolysaccharide export system protein LptC
MAFEANIVPGAQRHLVRTPEERARALVVAERHTKLVRFLRKALPVLAVLVLAGYFITSNLGMSVSVGDLTASIAGVEIADGNLRMVNPKLRGSDKKNGKYVIGADYADQDMKNPNIIKLHAIKAEMSSQDGGWSRMDAVRGVFDSKAERLVMKEKITIATSTGITGELKNASLETKTQTLRSHLPVSFVLTGGSVKANALTFSSGKSTLTFRGKVFVHILKRDKEGKPDKATPTAEATPPVTPPLPAQTATPGVMPPLPTDAATPLVAPPLSTEAAAPLVMPPLPAATPPAPSDTGALPTDTP